MISIRKATTEMDRIIELQESLGKCYLQAIRSSSDHAVEFDVRVLEEFRAQLFALEATFIEAASAQAYQAVQNTWRSELKKYQDQGREHVGRLRQELQAAAAAMRSFADHITVNGSDCETQIRQQIDLLDALAASEDLNEIRAGLRAATSTIWQTCEQLRRANQMTVVQLQDEIRQLHKAVERERSRQNRDHTSGAWGREKLDERIEHLLGCDEPFHVLFVSVRNYRKMQANTPRVAVQESLRALLERFGSILRGEAMIGRWCDNVFTAILETELSAAVELSEEIRRKLSASYTVNDENGPRRVAIEVNAGIVDRRRGLDAARFRLKLEQMTQALGGI